MKKVLFPLALLLSGWCATAQVPARISYQAVLRNSNDQLITNQTVGIRISIINIFNQAVYAERHTTTTNANGLISIEIGGGEMSSGSLEDIEWNQGSYRLKTETDPSGGTQYTIKGTTNILAVPYAFEANHARVADSLAPGRLKIGDRYQGGIIFWLDNTGEHGLIVDSITHAAKWNNGVNRYIGATADGYYGGRINTDLILASQLKDATGGYFAAKHCMMNGYMEQEPYYDWYLPSKSELRLMYEQKNLIPGLTDTGFFWSSTESLRPPYWEFADALDFSNGQIERQDKSTELKYRCIRSF